jgi:N-acetylglutamate synthase
MNDEAVHMGKPLLVEFAQQHITDAIALWQRSPGVGLSEADRPERLAIYVARNPGSSFVAIDGDELIGTVLCGHDGRRGLIHHLVVAPSHQRRGLARSLLRASLQALRQAHIDKCHLLVFKTNEPGLAFWRAVGADERVSLALFSVGTDNLA